MREEAEVLLNANNKITSPALAKTPKATFGVLTVPRTANRLKSDILEGGDKAVDEEFQALDNYLTSRRAPRNSFSTALSPLSRMSDFTRFVRETCDDAASCLQGPDQCRRRGLVKSGGAYPAL